MPDPNPSADPPPPGGSMLGGLSGPGASISPTPIEEDGVAGDRRERAESIGRAMNILLVEDSVVEARLAMGVLRSGQIKHHLNWLRDGAEAIDYLRREGRFANAVRPDLVLLDLRLPGADGAEVLAVVRDDPRLRDLPVVVMTSSTDEQDVKITSELTVQAYMTKPVNLEQFLDVVEKLKDYWKADMLVPRR